MPNLDPKNINGRIYNQVHELLLQLEEGEHITLKERIAALVAVSRIQVIFVSLRKEKVADVDAGTTVRKYASAFKANDPRRRTKVTRSAAQPEPEPDIDFDDDGSDDDAA